MSRFQSFIDDFNSGELEDIEAFFGDVETFLGALISFEIIDKIDFNNLENDIYNKTLYRMVNSNKPKVVELGWSTIMNLISDVNQIDGKYFLEIDRDDLKLFFCKVGRNENPQYVAELVFGEDHDDWTGYVNPDNVISDVVDELNAENLKYFKDKLYNKVKGKEIPSEELGNFEINDDEDYVIITDENFNLLFDEEDALSYMLDKLTDYKSELSSLFSNSYEDAYQSTIYKECTSALEEFMSNFKYDARTITRIDGTKKTYEVVVCDVTTSFEEIILTFLGNNTEYGRWSETLEYYGSYMGVLGKLFYDGDYDCLSPRFSDWPDSDLVTASINDLFKEYI